LGLARLRSFERPLAGDLPAVEKWLLVAYAVEKLGGGQRFPSDPDWSEVFLIGADPGLSV